MPFEQPQHVFHDWLVGHGEQWLGGQGASSVGFVGHSAGAPVPPRPRPSPVPSRTPCPPPPPPLCSIISGRSRPSQGGVLLANGVRPGKGTSLGRGGDQLPGLYQ